MTDSIKTLFEDAGLTDERMEEIAAHFRCAVDEQVMQELAGVKKAAGPGTRDLKTLANHIWRPPFAEGP